jgi:phosphoadenosine phosphosulfate reductase
MYNLPAYPLEQEGYLSVGCVSCTTKYCESISIGEREGSWQESNKNECGLHTEI